MVLYNRHTNIVSTMERTSIQICQQTRARLQNTGHMGETYDGLINRLLDERQQNRGENTGE